MFTHCPSIIKFSFHLDKCRYRGQGGKNLANCAFYALAGENCRKFETGHNTLDKRERGRGRGERERRESVVSK